MTTYNVDAMLERMATELNQFISERSIDDPMITGIHTGGVWIAERLHKLLNLSSEISTLNISFYRDDFTRIGVHPQVLPSRIKDSVEGRSIILVDDVLYTGRTIRAALNEIFDYGRPRLIKLAVLVDRGGRELPFQADVVGTHMQLTENQQVKLTGPSPLELSVIMENE